MARRIGVEIEFGHLDVPATVELIQRRFGGRAESAGPHQVEVVDSELGRLRVEMDSRFLKQEKHRELLDWLGIEDEDVISRLDRLVLGVATQFVPCELVTDPLELSQLEQLESLCADLREAGAEGTGAEPWYAFGVHFNPELPSSGVESLHAHLQAFVLLEDWLRALDRLDFTRRLSPFIDPFPSDYREHVLRGPVPGTRRQLVEDYLRFNATRNRGLDMLPAFMQLEPEIIEARIDDELVKPRPTFHYRLANCRIDDPEWRIAQEWAAWVEVERLAADGARRARLIESGEMAKGQA